MSTISVSGCYLWTVGKKEGVALGWITPDLSCGQCAITDDNIAYVVHVDSEEWMNGYYKSQHATRECGTLCQSCHWGTIWEEKCWIEMRDTYPVLSGCTIGTTLLLPKESVEMMRFNQYFKVLKKMMPDCSFHRIQPRVCKEGSVTIHGSKRNPISEETILRKLFEREVCLHVKVS